jgi:hypothetical protein
MAAPKYSPKEDLEGKMNSGNLTTNLAASFDLRGLAFLAALQRWVTRHVLAGSCVPQGGHYGRRVQSDESTYPQAIVSTGQLMAPSVTAFGHFNFKVMTIVSIAFVLVSVQRFATRGRGPSPTLCPALPPSPLPARPLPVLVGVIVL